MTATCQACGFELYHVVAELHFTTLGLYDDARFPGRAILTLNDHFDDLLQVPEFVFFAFVTEMRVAGAATQRAVDADRMNYAILGNAEAHVHAHLIPRIREGDPIPNKAPWAHPDPVTKLDPARRGTLIRSIAEQLSGFR